MLNHINLMGRMVRDPELRYTRDNTPVASFCLAVERDIASGNTGERKTDFIDCAAWRSIGEIVSKHFAKGQMAAVSGRLQIDDWTDKNGNKRKGAKVVCDTVYFCESKKDRGEYRPATYEEAKAGVFSELDDSDGELLF